jgi:hypothetical protein
LAAEPSTEALRKILREPLDNRIAISGTLSTTLLEFDNATTNFPVCGGHRGIDTSRDRSACCLQQCNDGCLNLTVALYRIR